MQSDRLGSEVRRVLAERRVSLRGAEIKTGISRTTIMKMTHGHVPSRASLYAWATAFGEPVNDWLALGGYAPIADHSEPPQNAPGSPAARSTALEGQSPLTAESVTVQPLVEVPEALHLAVITASTREAKVQVVWEWLWLRGPQLGLKFGAREGSSVDTRLELIRRVEDKLGIRLLSPEIV